MGKVNMRLSLDQSTRDALDRLSRVTGQDADAIATDAIARHVEWMEHEQAILAERLSEAETGPWVSADAVLRWMHSWGSDAPLPRPEPDVFRRD